MTLFSSDRERRLWLWTGVVLVAIYSTLGLARRLADTLGDNAAIGVWLFLACCFLVLAMVITQGLSRRPRGGEILVALGVVAAYLLVFVRMSVPTERSHLIEYGAVALLMHEALRERAANRPDVGPQDGRVRAPALMAILLASTAGVVDECIQWFVPGRVFDPIDIVFNVMAAVMAVSASVALRWASSTWRKI